MSTIKLPWEGWEVIELIGRGAFGTVYKIRRDIYGGMCETAAVKMLTVPENQSEVENLYNQGYDTDSIRAYFKTRLKEVLEEYSVILRLRGHPNIVYCDDIQYLPLEEGIGWNIYIKMELLQPLNKIEQRVYNEENVLRLAKDIGSALDYCSRQNIIHRDVKPANIFVTKDGTYKLGDFGVAKTSDGTASGSKTGTIEYMAPEVCKCEPYGESVDIYSLGLVMYWMMNQGTLPFMPPYPEIPTPKQKDTACIRRIGGEELPPPRNGSAALQKIMRKACFFEPKLRYHRAQEMLADLENIADPSIPAWDTPKPGQSEVTFVPPKQHPVPPEHHKDTDVPPERRGDTDVPPEHRGDTAVLPERREHTDVPHEEQPEWKPRNKRTQMAPAVIVVLLGVILALILFKLVPSFAGTASNGDDSAAVQISPARTEPPRTELPQTEPPKTEHVHIWEEATYDRPKTCTVCGATEGDPLPIPRPRFTDRLASGNYHSVLLRDNGTVAAAGYNGMESGENYGGRCDTEDWSNMVYIAAASHTVGVRADGTVIATGANESGQCYVGDWHDIASVAASNHHTVGLRYDGTVVAAGDNDYGQCDVSDWEDIVQVAASEGTTYGLTADGRIRSAGEKNYGKQWKNVKKIAASAYNLVALLEDGTVRQEGASSSWDDTADNWRNIVDIATGGVHTLGLTADGRVLCVMSSREGRDHGQGDVYDWDDIVDISAGMYFSAGLKSDGTIVAVGDDVHGELDIQYVKD